MKRLCCGVEGEVFFVEQRANAIIISPRCDLDPLTKEEFVQQLETARTSGERRVIVSMLHCKYLDSSALNALVSAKRSLNGRLAVVVPPESMIDRIFTIADFRQVIPIYASLEEALSDGDGI